MLPIAVAILDRIPREVVGTGYRRALLLGVAYAATIGGKARLDEKVDSDFLQLLDFPALPRRDTFVGHVLLEPGTA